MPGQAARGGRGGGGPMPGRGGGAAGNAPGTGRGRQVASGQFQGMEVKKMEGEFDYIVSVLNPKPYTGRILTQMCVSCCAIAPHAPFPLGGSAGISILHVWWGPTWGARFSLKYCLVACMGLNILTRANVFLGCLCLICRVFSSLSFPAAETGFSHFLPVCLKANLHQVVLPLISSLTSLVACVQNSLRRHRSTRWRLLKRLLLLVRRATIRARVSSTASRARAIPPRQTLSRTAGLTPTAWIWRRSDRRARVSGAGEAIVAAEGVGVEAEEGEEVEEGEEGEEGAVAVVGTKSSLYRGRLGQDMTWPTWASPRKPRLELSVWV